MKGEEKKRNTVSLTVGHVEVEFLEISATDYGDHELLGRVVN